VEREREWTEYRTGCTCCLMFDVLRLSLFSGPILNFLCRVKELENWSRIALNALGLLLFFSWMMFVSLDDKKQTVSHPHIICLAVRRDRL